MERRRFSSEFKKEVVCKSYEVFSVREYAEELGIVPSLLYTWRRASPAPLRNRMQEIKRLRRVVKSQALQLEVIEKGRLSNFQTRKDIYRFIEENKSIFPIEVMCKALRVSASAFERWRKLGDKISDKRKLDNQKYTPIIKEIFEKSRKTYGSPRIRAALEKLGYPVSRKRVHRIMVANGLRTKMGRKYRNVSGMSSATYNAKNLLGQNFDVKRMNEVWVSDLTYIPTKEGWIYLTTIMDLYNRQIIGWSLSKERTAIKTTLPAWAKAISTRKITQPLLFHSDRGIEYACNAFRALLKSNPLISQSMSRRGNCWDNAVAESFFKTIKYELIKDQKFKNFEEAEPVITEFIEVWYNKERLHSVLGYKTPYEVEQAFNDLAVEF